MADNTTLVKLIVQKKKAFEQLSHIINGIQGFRAVRETSAQQAPGVIIVELNNPDDVNLLPSLAEEEGTDEIFVISESKNPDLLMNAMRTGVKDFFTFPAKPEDIQAALQRFSERQTRTTGKKTDRKSTIISIAGSKGGVGATTAAVNLSAALSDSLENPRVALVDMNPILGEVPIFLDIMPKFTLGDIAQNIDRLDDAFLMNVMTRHDSGIFILPSPRNMEYVSPDPHTIERLFRLMKTQFDYIVVDLGQMTDDTSVKTLQLSDVIFLVAVQTIPCLTNTSWLVKSLTSYGFLDSNRVQVILNRHIKNSDITIGNVEESIEKKIYFVLPNDYKTTMSSMNNGKTLLDMAPKSPIAQGFIDLVEKITQGNNIKKPKKRGFFNWR